MIEIINKAWYWKGFNAIKIIQTNDFGNVIFESEKSEFWRICPEDASCEKIATNKTEYDKIITTIEFIEDWKMTNLVDIAKSKFGELNPTQKYCLKVPAILGGEYAQSNIGTISFVELIAFSGDLAFQIKDLKDGQTVKIKN